ncbi:MAG: hypothetical protein ACJA1L_000002 [Paracoccaceae bacterium]|jgi:hypothetical protein
MGHVRLGTLPRSRRWSQVVDLIGAGASVEDVAGASAKAAEAALGRASKDPAFSDAFWLLANLPIAARAPGWLSALQSLDLDLNSDPTLIELTRAVTDALDTRATSRGSRTDLGEMARLALVEALTDFIEPQLPSLFDPHPGEVRHAVGRLASGERFAELSRAFFATLMRRSLDYYLSRELANHIGHGDRFATDADRRSFDAALATHCVETSRIVREFAGGWYGKTVWRDGDLSREAAGRFAGVAFKKLRAELGRRADAA